MMGRFIQVWVEMSIYYVTASSNGVQQAQDNLLEIPAVGRNGGTPLAKFLE